MRSLPGSILLLALLSLSGCGAEERVPGSGASSDPSAHEPAAAGFPVRIPDATGRVIILDSPPRRIVSLVPSASETLLDLGSGDRLVGRTDFDEGGALAQLPSVGGGLHPNYEAIVSLEPDLVIRFAGASDAATPRRLDQMGIPHLAVHPESIREIQKTVRDLGAMTGRRERADAILAEMDAMIEDIRNRVQGLPRPRVGYLLGGTPPWVAGPGSYIEDLLHLAGGENVFSDLQGPYGPVNIEVFLARKVDILLAKEGVEVPWLGTGISVRRVTAAVEIPSPRVAEAALELVRVLHPEAFR